MTELVLVEVEEALGPGIEFERDPTLGLVGRSGRPDRGWTGLDRAALVDSDDGSGARVPVVVAVPTSSFRDARLLVELSGGWRLARGVVLAARLPGMPVAPESIARVAAGAGEDDLVLYAGEAEHQARLARQRYRERRSRGRIVGGRAWYAIDALSPTVARYGTPHSLAEYSLRRVPPRFVRGLERLLDDDERVLYWVERPMRTDIGLLDRLRDVDRRSALLLLTDRQLLWMVDHAQPDRYLLDWGVDVRIIPVERVLRVHPEERHLEVAVVVEAAAGPIVVTLPVELRAEALVLARLLRRFTPDGSAGLPRRRYALDPIAFDAEVAVRFGQLAEAERLYEQAAATGDVLAFFFAPRRDAQRQPAALVLRPDALELVSVSRPGRIRLVDVRAIDVTLSPLVGRIALASDVALSYPAPLLGEASALVRLARRALANTA